MIWIKDIKAGCFGLSKPNEKSAFPPITLLVLRLRSVINTKRLQPQLQPLIVLVGGTGFEPVTSTVKVKRDYFNAIAKILERPRSKTDLTTAKTQGKLIAYNLLILIEKLEFITSYLNIVRHERTFS